jgi:hypothetical protein
MSTRSISAGKKTIIGAKVTKGEKGKIISRCSNLKCTTSDYIKGLIQTDLKKAAEGNVLRISFEGDKILLPCVHCGGPVPFNLVDLGLRRI